MVRPTLHNLVFACVTTALLASLLTPALARPDSGLDIKIREAYLRAPAVLRLEVALSGLQPDAGNLVMALRVGLQPHSNRAVSLPPLPPTLSQVEIEVDLRTGSVRLGGISVGTVDPVPPPVENLRVYFDVAVSQGDAQAADHRAVTVPLPTVIVPGYLNDLSGPDASVMAGLEARGYQTKDPTRTVFWFTYPSRRLSLADASAALAAYVRDVVLPASYAARINVIGYSLGGLLARWNLAFNPAWAQLVNRLILAAVPNEGAVMAYVLATYPVATLARTPAARDLLPTFPFWRPAPGAAWGFPSDVRNVALGQLNAHALPRGLRVYAFYGTGEQTPAGITGAASQGDAVYGPGDGIVLADSSLGASFHGGPNIAGFDQYLDAQVDLGAVHHGNVLRAAISRIGDALLDRFGDFGSVARERPLRAHRESADSPAVWDFADGALMDGTTGTP
jgi:hypothetical protein